jgi:phospholipid/cholesterol/gamma-HCH transport system ATP-binding protein
MTGVVPRLAAAGRGSDELLRATALTSRFGTRTVLQDIDLTVRGGEVFVVMGPSGCGKTTLLRHLCGLMPPAQGVVTIAGRDIYRATAAELHRLRQRTGLSFQGGALLGSLSVIDNVALPLRENTDLPERVILATARMKLEMVGLLHAAELPPSALSGGMRKRAAVARAIALDPEIVFFDEPSAGLDPITAAEIDNLIGKLNKVFGITMVVVTHDLSSAYQIADRIVMLLDGRIAAIGTRDEVWRSTDPRLRSFIERRRNVGIDRSMDVAAHMEL